MATGAARAMGAHDDRPIAAAVTPPARNKARRVVLLEMMLLPVISVPLSFPMLQCRFVRRYVNSWMKAISPEARIRVKMRHDQEADSTGRLVSTQAQGPRAL